MPRGGWAATPLPAKAQCLSLGAAPTQSLGQTHPSCSQWDLMLRVPISWVDAQEFCSLILPGKAQVLCVGARA